MDFISNKKPQQEAMCKELGIDNIIELFKAVPKELLLPKPKEEDGISEYEVEKLMQSLASKNTFTSLDNYLGGGAYEHHVPSLVGAICSKSEFLTSYTPYQPEVSQGMLQAIFEFQSVVCALTGMDVANASVYDAASAAAEACLMALRSLPDRKKIIISETVHPHVRKTIEQYVSNLSVEIDVVPFQKNGQLDQTILEKKLDDKTAALLIQSPNFLGVLEESAVLAKLAKEKGALIILAANPLSYGIYASAQELGIDIAVGDMQPLGLSLQFGGPYVGYIACKEALVRQMPGRIVGETLDTQGKRGFVLTLQAREQHIRREKATSNICSNQALAALATLVGTLWHGPKGLEELALTSFRRASYLKSELEKIKSIKTFGDVPMLNEFAVNFGVPYEKLLPVFIEKGIAPGIDLGRFYKNLNGWVLVAVTETKSKEQLDKYVLALKEIK